MANDINSNDVILSIADETTIGVLPGTPIWRAREPNTFADLGGNVSVAHRAFIGTRKKQQGSLVGIDAKAGWNEDFTLSNFLHDLQGFFCADVLHDISTQPQNGTALTVNSVSSVDESYNIASGSFITNGFVTRMLFYASGFTNPINNGVKKITGSLTATKALTSSNNLVTETPPAGAKMEGCGVQFSTGDASMTYNAPTCTLVTVTADLTTFGLSVGEWVFLGSDNSIQNFATVLPGYARIASIAAHAIVFDKTTFTPATDTGTGQNIRMYFGKVLKDAATAKIRTYQIERKLGNDGGGIQTEYVIGAFSNELTLNVPKRDKYTADLSYIAIAYATQTGATGPKAGTRQAAAGEVCYNTSTDVYQHKLCFVDPTTLNPTALFAYITTATLKLTNNGSINEAIGSAVGFDVNLGDFEFGGSLEAYFTQVSSLVGPTQYKLATVHQIMCKSNMGWVWDIPLMELTGTMAKPEKSKPVMLPVTKSAVQNANGYVALANFFPYLPAVAMSAQNQSLANSDPILS